jgi:heme O synthase-like polyprenyltransferase
MDIITAEIEETKVTGVREKLAAYLELTKPRIAFMLVLTSAAGFYLGSYQGFNFVTFINSIIGIGLLAFGVATLNQYIERKSVDFRSRAMRGR